MCDGVFGLDPTIFPNPERFQPERWLRDSPSYSRIDPVHFLPFGHGPRACPGQRFARVELYMMVFRLVQKYKLGKDIQH